MRTNWFRTRTPSSPERDRFFRPELEALEGRLAPSNVVPFGHGNGNGNGHGHGNDNGGDPPAPVAAPINQTGGINVVGDHNNIHINNSFNGVPLPGFSMLSAGQSVVLGKLFLLSDLLATELSSSNLGSLINDEIALAVDKYLASFPAVASAIPTLSTDISTLQSDTAANPLESTPLGSIVGMLAFDVASTALTTAQPTI